MAPDRTGCKAVAGCKVAVGCTEVAGRIVAAGSSAGSFAGMAVAATASMVDMSLERRKIPGRAGIVDYMPSKKRRNNYRLVKEVERWKNGAATTTGRFKGRNALPDYHLGMVRKKLVQAAKIVRQCAVGQHDDIPVRPVVQTAVEEDNLRLGVELLQVVLHHILKLEQPRVSMQAAWRQYNALFYTLDADIGRNSGRDTR